MAARRPKCLAASPSCRLRSTELISGLCGVQAARPTVEPGQVLPRCGRADAQLVRRIRDRADFDVGDERLELAAGWALTDVGHRHALRATAARSRSLGVRLIITKRNDC